MSVLGIHFTIIRNSGVGDNYEKNKFYELVVCMNTKTHVNIEPA